MLLSHDIGVRIIDFRAGKEQIFHCLERFRPGIVGFSIIFQYHIEEFRELIRYLRQKGITAHFCAGGHYPSLRYASLLEYIPELDSVVLFEGEQTFLELTQATCSGRRWTDIPGIAYRKGKRILRSSHRPLEKNLDVFPPPVRQPLRTYAFDRKYATILAGRGCYHACSFCSIREFYTEARGPVKRLRQPEMVVREMQLLHEEGCSIFMFQDDDFPLSGPQGEAWVRQFCQLLRESGLGDRIMWKINCRPDEIDKELFDMMRHHGLFLVYLGIENGTQEGLRMMKKGTRPGTIIKAVEVLNGLGILFDYGFMLFHPDTTVESILDNLDFLERICGEGASPVTFCKMLPYAGTFIERRLEKEGRLRGREGFLDYEFLDIRVTLLYQCISQLFRTWITEHDGLLNNTRWARYHVAVFRKYFAPLQEVDSISTNIKQCIAESNRFFIDTVRHLVKLLGESRRMTDHVKSLPSLQQRVAQVHDQYNWDVIESIKALTAQSRMASVMSE